MSDAPITPIEFASKLRAIGISKPYASQLANGRRTPSLPMAVKIEAELGVPVSHWFERRDQAA